jgi:hypothetical protein
MDKLVRLKAWPMFALFFLLPFTAVITYRNTAFTDYNTGVTVARIVVLSVIILYFAWIHAACVKLCEHLPAGITLSINRVRIGLLTAVLYLLWAILQNLIFLTGIGISWLVANNSWLPVFSQILCAVWMIGTVYSIGYMARLLKTVEEEEPVGFTGFIGDFFLILFIPIGIWNIQARLNDIAARIADDMDIFKQDPVY